MVFFPLVVKMFRKVAFLTGLSMTVVDARTDKIQFGNKTAAEL